MITHVITIANTIPSDTGPIDGHAFSAFLAGLFPGENTNVDLVTNGGIAMCNFMAGGNRGRIAGMDGRFILETIDKGDATSSPVMDSLDDVREAIRSYFKGDARPKDGPI